jgi:hypothetical protein
VRRVGRIGGPLVLLAYGAWTGLFAVQDARADPEPLGGVVGQIVFVLQTIPSLVLGSIGAVGGIAAERVGVLGVIMDVAIGAGAFVVFSFAVFVALAYVPASIPSFAVGLALVGTMALSHWPQARLDSVAGK